MMTMITIYCGTVLFVVFVGSSSGFLLDFDLKTKWDALKVTWGPNVADSNYFVSMPRTSRDALDQGFKKISDCDVTASWRGSRYMKGNDTFLVLLYDVNGYISGIQTTVPSGQADGYPSSGIQPPFVKDGNNFILTAYFVNPVTICSTGRSSNDFSSQGTGRNLYLQNGTNAERDYILIPFKETDTSGTKWSKGSCVPTMGIHYWYNPTEGMDCDDFFPMFPLYNGGVLSGFGWAIGTQLSSPHLDHPFIAPSPGRRQARSSDPVTKCLTSFRHLSTMHIYMTSDISQNKC